LKASPARPPEESLAEDTMPTAILEVHPFIAETQKQAAQHTTKIVIVDGHPVTIPSPFPSPADWRDSLMYFVMTDRFNGLKDPKSQWDQKFNLRQGGTFEGVRRQLGYLQELGVGAIWLSPVLKNSRPEKFEFTYPGYTTQDFLNVDERFATDGTRATAEQELAALVDEAHARGIYLVLDIVLNHAGRVFDYHLSNGAVVDSVPLDGEMHVEWLNGFGFPRDDWEDQNLPEPAKLSPDDAVWPSDLQRPEFFRRRGNKASDTPDASGFVPGDFGSMRQLVAEYDATVSGQGPLRTEYGPQPVLSVLIQAYQYLVAKYDFDGFRIDTVKYVRPDLVETFGNAMREYALSLGKKNFFTFGEIYDNEGQINRFIGRSGSDTDGFGIDAALDFPLFFVLPGAAKGMVPVENVRQVFEKRKDAEKSLISSHGEAGRYFVSFVDNHDQNRRFNDPQTPQAQVTLGMAVLFCLQGIPCVYYGTEQGLQGTNDGAGHSTLDSMESVREALWGKKPVAFDTSNPFYLELKRIAQLRSNEPPLRYGRIYFRPVSGNGQDFGQSFGNGGMIAFSRILTDREVVIVANTSFGQPFNGSVLVDFDLARHASRFQIGYSNKGTSGITDVQVQPGQVFPLSGAPGLSLASVQVSLKPQEVQILVPTS
jgi:glycosidase